MQLRLPLELAGRYKSPSQRTRVVTEAWGESNLYCASCNSRALRRLPHNVPATDFVCPICDSPYQLKSQKQPFARRIADAAYSEMCRAIQQGRTPNIFALHYDPRRWEVRTLLLVPHYAYSLSAIEARRPLSPKAERRGWVGCYIALDRIPPDAKIPVVLEGTPVSVASVRKRYDRLRPLQRQDFDSRGWTLDVLNVVRTLGKDEFTLSDMYSFADELHRLHPRNRHVDEKIRQQLQRLRNLGFLQFVERGRYRVLR